MQAEFAVPRGGERVRFSNTSTSPEEHFDSFGNMWGIYFILVGVQLQFSRETLQAT